MNDVFQLITEMQCFDLSLNLWVQLALALS
jgi:hypothetical protein